MKLKNFAPLKQQMLPFAYHEGQPDVKRACSTEQHLMTAILPVLAR